MICTPPEAFGTAPKSFCAPANYIYFDLIVSYLIILTTKFVKLPILLSQISPCRPKTNFVKLFPWPFWALPPRPGQSKLQHPPRYLSTPPRYLSTPPERKYENPSLAWAYRPLAHDVIPPVTMHLEDKLAIYA